MGIKGRSLKANEILTYCNIARAYQITYNVANVPFIFKDC